MTQKPASKDKALALIGVTEVEWWPTVAATVEGAHKLTEAIVTMAYHALEDERKTCSDIPPLTIAGKVNLSYEAVLRERALVYLQSLKVEADASTLELLADIFNRQLYMHHPDQWGSLSEFLQNMALGKSESYKSIIGRFVEIVVPFLQVEGLATVREMMELVTSGGLSNLYHLLPHMLDAVQRADQAALAELLRDAKALGRSEIFDKYKRDRMRVPPAKATLRRVRQGFDRAQVMCLYPMQGPPTSMPNHAVYELTITMDNAQKGVILNALGRRIEYE